MSVPSTVERVVSHVGDGVATVRLEPGAIDAGVAGELVAHVREAEADPEVRAILIVARPAWDAGVEDLCELVRAVRHSPKITIAAVDGAVTGGGLELMAAHDVVLAAASTSFAFAADRRIDADEARARGLVNLVVSDPDLLFEAIAFAARIAAGSRTTFGER
jgi:enoyl-CoA hydratase/carnithine racemase